MAIAILLWVSGNAAHVKPIEPCLKGVTKIVANG